MDYGLRRIEATLDQLARPSIDHSSVDHSSIDRPSVDHSSSSLNERQPEASRGSQPQMPESTIDLTSSKNASTVLSTTTPAAQAPIVQPFPTQPPATLPQSAAKASTLGHDLAIDLLKDIEQTVFRWQVNLDQTISQIQALYSEGPIVDAWLESYSSDTTSIEPSGTATLRHGEVDRLMDYVESICQVHSQAQPLSPVDTHPRAGYRLCGLDVDGKLWSQPCPAQQVPYVSLAIARYQKLRTLLDKKQTIETRLSGLIAALTQVKQQSQA